MQLSSISLAVARLGTASPFSNASLNLDFTRPDQTLDPRITFTRASSATRTNSAGFIESVADNGPRFDYDLVTKAPKGLLIEEQRTNLLTYSEQFDDAAWAKVAAGTGSVPVVTPNTAVAPNGTLTADRIVFDKGAGTTATDQCSISNGSPTTVTGQPTSAFIWLKSATSNSYLMQLNFNGQISEGAAFPTLITVTPTWNKFEIRIASAIDANRVLYLRLRGAQGTSDYADVHVWGSQQENAAFPTSYIPTVASQVTRAADTALIAGTNFSSWYNQSEGTLFSKYDCLGDSAFDYTFSMSDGTSSNLIATGISSTQRNRGIVVAGGINSAVLTGGGTGIAGVLYAEALAYKLNDFALAGDGVLRASDSLGDIPVVNQASLSSSYGVVNQFNGHIQKIAYFPRRLFNSELQSITA
jgi:hypothetical protein